jgi:hypothetical protein
MSSSWRLPRRLDLTAWEKMSRMKKMMRMAMMEEMPPHPPVAMAPPPAPTPPVAATPKEIVEEEDPMEMVLEQEAPVVHGVILADAEPELPQLHLYHMLMRDYEESSSRMMDDLDDLDDLTKASSDMDEWFPEDESND